MRYLVYQLERGENGTTHYQGYVEFKKRQTLNGVKELLGSQTIHVERRRGSAKQASEYCKKADTRVEGSDFYEFGEPPRQGKRSDLEDFKDAVIGERKRKRDLIDDYYGTIARYPKFYETLTSICRPKREAPLEVILHIGETGLGKTKTVFDRHGEDAELYITPLSNGTPWYDGYDGHKIVLLDDFSGASSHMQLVTLLRLLDRYPVQVPVKGAHTWWLPDKIYVTTNILPKEWYKWEKRGEHYCALARRFTSVVLFYSKLHEEDPGFVEQDRTWWQENAPEEAKYLNYH